MITVSVTGLDELIARVKNLPDEITQELSGTIRRGAQLGALGAKRDAPRNAGILAGGIDIEATNDPLLFTVNSRADYSAYVEWGTITKVSVPPDLLDYAALFQGRGIRKNGGMNPRPFFFRQTEAVQAYLDEAIPNFLNSIELE